jgi:hypothetical protein
MYQSHKKNQRGGDYITSTQPNSALSTPYISLSTLQFLQSTAHLSNIRDVASLSIEQLTPFINSIDQQIERDTVQIAANLDLIVSLKKQIEVRPGGLQEREEIADYNYRSVLTQFNNLSSLTDYDKLLLRNANSTLTGLSSLLEIAVSSVNGYQSQYDRLLNELSINQAKLIEYDAIFAGQVADWNKNDSRRQIVQSDLNGNILILNSVSAALSTANSQYLSAATVYGNKNIEYKNFSTGELAIAANNNISVGTYYSSIFFSSVFLKSTLKTQSVAVYLAKRGLEIATSDLDYNSTLSIELSTIADLNTTNTTLSSINLELITRPGDQTLINERAAAQSLILGLSARLSSIDAHLHDVQLTQSILRAIDLNDRINIQNDVIFVARGKLADATLAERLARERAASLSSGIFNTYEIEKYLDSTIKGLSSIVIGENIQIRQLQSVVYQFDVSSNILTAEQGSTLSQIQIYKGLSSVYGISIGSYRSTYEYYSTLDVYAQSSIIGYEIERRYVTDDISTINGDIRGLDTAIRDDLGNLATFALQWFSSKRSELDSETDEYEYWLREFNAIIGMTTADVLNLKGNNYIELDQLFFSLQQINPPLTDSQKQGIQRRQKEILDINNKIDDIVGILNPIEVKFNTLIQYVIDLKQLKRNFISMRETTYTTEYNVLSYPATKQDVKGQYLANFDSMDTIVDNINSKVWNRDQLLASIIRTIGQIKSQITSYIGVDRFPDTFVNARPPENVFIKVSRNPLANLTTLQFSLLPFIDFSN